MTGIEVSFIEMSTNHKKKGSLPTLVDRELFFVKLQPKLKQKLLERLLML